MVDVAICWCDLFPWKLSSRESMSVKTFLWVVTCGGWRTFNVGTRCHGDDYKHNYAIGTSCEWDSYCNYVVNSVLGGWISTFKSQGKILTIFLFAFATSVFLEGFFTEIFFWLQKDQVNFLLYFHNNNKIFRQTSLRKYTIKMIFHNYSTHQVFRKLFWFVA